MKPQIPKFQQEKTNEFKSFFEILRNSIFFIAIYLYYTGFVYVYDLYQKIGISINNVDIPIYSYIIYSYNVFLDNWWLLIICIILYFILYILIIKFIDIKKIIVGTLIVLFPLLTLFANNTSENKYSSLIKGTGSKFVKFQFRDEQIFSKKIIEANDSNKLIMLTTTRDDYYVLCKMRIYIIPKIEIKYLSYKI